MVLMCPIVLKNPSVLYVLHGWSTSELCTVLFMCSTLFMCPNFLWSQLFVHLGLMRCCGLTCVVCRTPINSINYLLIITWSLCSALPFLTCQHGPVTIINGSMMPLLLLTMPQWLWRVIMVQLFHQLTHTPHDGSSLPRCHTMSPINNAINPASYVNYSWESFSLHPCDFNHLGVFF